MRRVTTESRWLLELIEKRRAQDGKPHSERVSAPFEFAEYIAGLNAGRADAAQRRGEEQTGVLL